MSESDLIERPSMFLREDEVRELTQRMQHKAQIAVLNAMGIGHKVRPDGSIIVLRSVVEGALGAKPKRALEFQLDGEAL